MMSINSVHSDPGLSFMYTPSYYHLFICMSIIVLLFIDRFGFVMSVYDFSLCIIEILESTILLPLLEGIVTSLVILFKSLIADKFLPFHEVLKASLIAVLNCHPLKDL